MNEQREQPAGKLLIITGISGAGKSMAINFLEDLGYYCVDNLPVMLLSKFLELIVRTEGKINRVALGIDIREKAFFGQITEILDELALSEIQSEILFFDADTPTLVKRFSETRRKHPLDGHTDLMRSIEAERGRLLPLRQRASRVINTSVLTIHELKTLIYRDYHDPAQPVQRMKIQIVAFGFFNGLPIQADMLFDTRFLPNPHYIPELSPLTGNDPEVRDYVLNNETAKQYLRKIKNLLLFLIPQWEREQKSYLTIAVGCTGGRHRSIAVANALGSFLQKKNCHVTVEHRDLEYPGKQE